MVRSRPISTSRWVTVMPTVETTAKSTIRAPHPPTTAPMMNRVSWSVAETGPVPVAARVANEPISAVPSSTVTNVASEAVARCRSEAKASRVMTPPPLDQLVEVRHLSGDRVGGGPVHPARDPSVDEEDHGVGVRRRDRVVGDHDDRLAQVVDAGPQQGQHLVRGPGVEGAGRLVGQDDRGVGDQRPGDRDALLLAAGELRGQPPAPVAEPDLLQQRPHPLPVDAVSGQPDRQPDVLLGGEVGHQVEALEDEADALAAEPGAVLLAPVRDVLAGDDDAALGGPLETGGAGEERRLARPGGPHHRGEGAGREGEVDTGEGGDGARPFAVRAGEVVDLQCRGEGG